MVPYIQQAIRKSHGAVTHSQLEDIDLRVQAAEVNRYVVEA